MSDQVSARVIIAGRVQGVFFRLETKKQADVLGVHGWVRNKADGTVEALFQGDKSRVDRAINWCYTGSPNSIVKSVDVKWESDRPEKSDFSIRY